MTTDNRTNEPTEAQVEAAARAIYSVQRPGGVWAENQQPRWHRKLACAALEAALVASSRGREQAMSAIAGIKLELAEFRRDREEEAEVLDKAHKKFVEARNRIEMVQKRVEFLNDRIESLAKALTDLGGTDDDY